MTNYPKGSEWRRWDLHVHTKGTMKNDQFTSTTFNDFCIILFQKALEKGITAIGITDYFNIDNYTSVKEFVSNIESDTHFDTEEREQIKRIFILPNVELRMLPVTDSGRLVNIHCLFNPDYVSRLENDFFGSIEYSAGSGKKCKMNRQGLIDLGKFLDSKLNDEKAYQKGINSFAVTHSDLQKLLDENIDFRKNVILAVSNSNKDGASALQKNYDLFEDAAAGSLDAVRKSIYKISDCIFSSNQEDIKYFMGSKTDDKKVVIDKCGSLKPCIHGSDAHTEKDLFKPDEQRYCWIKADLTFKGLKQLIYEPASGERVKISPIEPDQKDGYKVISKIKFSNTSDFPDEIEFNKNLCSIIGSRSSGKSALLAYVAHSVDKEFVEKIIDGPGEGSDYHWDKIKINHSIEWGNGKSNDESPGNIVYIPQNYLFKESKDSNEIKEKIKPALFKVLPGFKVKYAQAEKKIEGHNQQISEHVDDWFDLSDSIKSIDEKLKELGDNSSIKKEKKDIESKIQLLKDTYQLRNDDFKQYQEIRASQSRHNDRIDAIKTELSQLSDVSEKSNIFSELKITLIPTLTSLPKRLQDTIRKSLKEKEDGILMEVNKQAVDYKKSIEKEKKETEETISKINEKNKELIEKYNKNIEIEAHIEKLNKYNKIIKEIDDAEKEKKNSEDKLREREKAIKSVIDQRKSQIEELVTNMDNADPNILQGIKFGVEYGFDENFEIVTQKINIKETSNFTENHKLTIDKIREKPEGFLSDLYSGEQKIIRGHEKKQVARDVLSLTEKILFNAEMEGDKIGGFSEPTMTPGKRALFLLRLILHESEDTWPLLIDQPEDDLDSRSIYDDIVPFLKKKKKERQIIMISHDANLVIGSDSEQVIVANRHGTDRKNADGRQFNYLTGSLEYSKTKDVDCNDTLKAQGVCEHACEILDGGKIAFEQRKNKYNIK